MLLEKAPELADEETAVEENRRLMEGGQTVYGYTPEELSGIIDHRNVLVLRDALAYRDLLAKQEKVKKDVRSKKRKGKTLKPGNKKSEKKGSSKTRRVMETRNRARKSGRLADAADAIAEIID